METIKAENGLFPFNLYLILRTTTRVLIIDLHFRQTHLWWGAMIIWVGLPKEVPSRETLVPCCLVVTIRYLCTNQHKPNLVPWCNFMGTNQARPRVPRSTAWTLRFLRAKHLRTQQNQTSSRSFWHLAVNVLQWITIILGSKPSLPWESWGHVKINILLWEDEPDRLRN